MSRNELFKVIFYTLYYNQHETISVLLHYNFRIKETVSKWHYSALTLPSALTRLQRLKLLLGMTLLHPKTIEYQMLIALNIQR